MLQFMGSQRVGHDLATELNFNRTEFSFYLKVWRLELNMSKFVLTSVNTNKAKSKK